jgi:hypothetical protein
MANEVLVVKRLVLRSKPDLINRIVAQTGTLNSRCFRGKEREHVMLVGGDCIPTLLLPGVSLLSLRFLFRPEGWMMATIKDRYDLYPSVFRVFNNTSLDSERFGLPINMPRWRKE